MFIYITIRSITTIQINDGDVHDHGRDHDRGDDELRIHHRHIIIIQVKLHLFQEHKF